MTTVSDAPTPSSFDSAVFRTVIGTVTSGVMVLTARDDDGDHGMTISAVSSLSLEPPMLLVCLNMNSRTQQAVLSAGSFAVHVLDDRQAWIAERFAKPSGDDKFEGVTVGAGSVSAPVLSDALAVVECRVREAVTGGTHRVFLADVVHAQAREGSPLAYYRGKFGRFELAQDAKAYQRIRSMVLNCVLGPDQELDAPTLAESLGAGLSSIHYALTRLVGEGLVLRTAERGHVVTPLDAARSDDAFDARLVIELGVAELTVGRLSPEQLAELRMLAQTSVARLEGGGGGRCRGVRRGVRAVPCVPAGAHRQSRPAGGLRAAEHRRPDVPGADLGDLGEPTDGRRPPGSGRCLRPRRRRRSAPDHP